MKNYLKNNHSLSQATYPYVRLLPKGKKPGLIKIESGRILHKHEMVTMSKLSHFGGDIFCHAESKLMKTADIDWQGESWEIKHVKGKSRHTLGKIKKLFDHNKEIIKIVIISGKKYCSIHRK